MMGCITTIALMLIFVATFIVAFIFENAEVIVVIAALIILFAHLKRKD